MDELLATLAKDTKLAIPEEQVAAYAPTIRNINRIVAEAAPKRLGIDRPPSTFDSFRASYADESKAGGA